MNRAAKISAPPSLDRINLRLSPEMFTAIDAARMGRPGNVSRNTWITEAVQEKLLRESTTSDQQLKAGS